MTASVSSRPGRLQWLITRGNDFAYTLTFEDADGVAIDKSGATFTAKVLTLGLVDAQSLTVDTTDAATGVLVVSGTDTVSSALTGSDYRWKLDETNGDLDTTLIDGPFLVAAPGNAGLASGSSSATVTISQAADVTVTCTAGGTVSSGGGGGEFDGDASDVPFTPAGNVAADNVQDAIEELDTEKAATSHTHTLSSITDAGDSAGLDVGTTTGTVAAGDDSRFTDSRTPTGSAGGVLSGTYPNPGFAADMATQSELDAKVSDTAYDATSWNGVTGVAPSKNAVRDKFETLVIGTDVQAHSTVLDNTTASFTTADETKLDGIEALADVTDATNVAAAGAVMEGDTSTASMQFVVDEDAMTSNSATKVPTQQSVKAYADTKLKSSDASVTDIIALTQAEYDLLTPDATTLYFITDAP